MIIWLKNPSFHRIHNSTDFSQHHEEYFQEFIMESSVLLSYSRTSKPFAKFPDGIAIFWVFPVMGTLVKKTDRLKPLAFELDVTDALCGH